MTKAQPCCRECGKPLAPRKARSGQPPEYCDKVCRAKFNNRRSMRGAELYDYFMAVRYQRKTHAVAMSIMSQMASHWKEADERDRDGRPSWVTPDLSADPKAFEA
jgi:hypothetical protein